MKQFKSGEQTWDVSINVLGVKRVKSALDIDLIEAINTGFIEKLIGNPIDLCNVLYVICKEQCDERDMSDEDFGRMLAGDTIEHATKAFIEGLIDFFPKAKGDLLRKAMTKFEEIERKAMEVAEMRVDELNVDEMASKILERGSMATGD